MSDHRVNATRGGASMHTVTPDFDACYAAVTARDTRFDGQLYLGVRTTGIYCRPSCPARTPKPANVVFFGSAAAAEQAGFRACRRCRPDLAPGRWVSPADDLARRALSLIEDGTVDRHGVDGLARRLHVSSRHLHRVLVEQVGAGPQALARTRRARLARQLVENSGWTLTRVAFAAGYASLRQFQSEFRRSFGVTASALRAGTPGDDGSATLHLFARQPFDHRVVVDWIATSPLAGRETVADGILHRQLGRATVTARPHPRGVSVTLTGDHPVGPVVAGVRRLFDLDADPQAIDRHLGADPILGTLVERRPGLRVPGAIDGFETTIRAILSQRISLAAAATLAGRLGRHGWSPRALATAPLEDIGLPRAKAATIRAVATAVAHDDLRLDPGADEDDTRAALLAIPGIGPWTVGVVLMRALNRPDAWPSGDLALRRAVEGLTGRAHTAAAVDMRAEAWRPWRAYAAMHLWGHYLWPPATSIADPDRSAS